MIDNLLSHAQPLSVFTGRCYEIAARKRHIRAWAALMIALLFVVKLGDASAGGMAAPTSFGVDSFLKALFTSADKQGRFRYAIR